MPQNSIPNPTAISVNIDFGTPLVPDVKVAFAEAKYPFIKQSFILIPRLTTNLYGYDPTSCVTIAQVCRAGMKTISVLRTADPILSSVSVMSLLDDLWLMYWNAYVAFSAVALYPFDPSQVMSTVTITAGASQLLDAFTQWDEALQANPFANIGNAMNTIIGGVTP